MLKQLNKADGWSNLKEAVRKLKRKKKNSKGDKARKGENTTKAANRICYNEYVKIC